MPLPPSLAFCLLLKISWGNPYLKVLDLANLFVADAPMKNEQFSFTPSQSTLKNRSKTVLCFRGLTVRINRFSEVGSGSTAFGSATPGTMERLWASRS